jgi:hypothetical protein
VQVFGGDKLVAESAWRPPASEDFEDAGGSGSVLDVIEF